jgi:hypothetical protein
LALSIGSSRSDLSARALANGWNIVCSAGGLSVIDSAGNPVPDDQTGQSGAAGPQCLFCLPLMHGDMALAGAAVHPADPFDHLNLRQSLPVGDRFAQWFSPTEAWPRAPPSFPIG